jgi:replicative DNA helicase
MSSRSEKTRGSAPLHSREAEVRLLGAVIHEGRVMGAGAASAMLDRAALRRQDFSAPDCSLVFHGLGEILKRSLAPLRGLVRQEIVRSGAEAFEMDEFFEGHELVSEAEVLSLSATVRNLASRRRAVEGSNRVRAMAESGEMDELELADELMRVAREVPGVSSGLIDHPVIADRSDARVRSVQDARFLPTVATGFDELDQITGGFQPTLNVVCGMPGRAKSAFLAACLRNMARRGDRAAIFSMEDPGEWLTFRWSAHESRIPNFVLQNRPLTEGQWSKYAEASSAVRSWSTVWIDDRPGLRPNEVLHGAREAFQMGARAVFLDNMTAMRIPRTDRRDLEFQDFLTQARSMAKEVNRPFVVVSHTKLIDGRKIDDMPRLIDCSESSSFDKLARLAYGVVKREDEVHIGVLKNNNGAAGKQVALKFDPISALVIDSAPGGQSEIPL